ncbi:hypothetical protein [Planctomyces sp. SH-PL62]|uniref:hypothetical protein n=1 Tax=Planctomyces sp. SH-PL62 TaxID=1636152 RepID=UPI00078D8832|nr:hypothetical protein [Planctomyces sp. SH-PL62]AMV37414.1 hypothetical protein VT85_08265 [Planctomyces sp. SH-PL62]
MLADFAMRLAFGLAVAATAAPRRSTPASYFRTLCLVMLGGVVLAILASRGRDGFPAGWGFGLMIATAAVAYVGSASWGLGRSSVGTTALAALAGLSGAWLAGLSFEEGGPSSFNSISRWASGVAMGGATAAMLMGHQYLTAPTASIGPLRRGVALMATALAARALLATVGLLMAGEPLAGLSSTSSAWLFPSMRWGMGLAGPSAAAFLAWRAVAIRSTQSATGILYAATALVLFGELVSLMVSRAGAPIL